VSEVMTLASKLITVKETDKIGYCRKLMVANKIRRLPVLDNDYKPIGIISISQIDSAIQMQDSELESVTLYGTYDNYKLFSVIPFDYWTLRTNHIIIN